VQRGRTLILIQRVLEALAGLELRLLRGRDLDFLAGARVAADTGFALGDMEVAEADDADFLLGLQRTCDGFEYGVNGLGSVRLGKAGVLGDFGNEIVLVHG